MDEWDAKWRETKRGMETYDTLLKRVQEIASAGAQGKSAVGIDSSTGGETRTQIFIASKQQFTVCSVSMTIGVLSEFNGARERIIAKHIAQMETALKIIKANHMAFSTLSAQLRSAVDALFLSYSTQRFQWNQAEMINDLGTKGDRGTQGDGDGDGDRQKIKQPNVKKGKIDNSKVSLSSVTSDFPSLHVPSIAWQLERADELASVMCRESMRLMSVWTSFRSCWENGVMVAGRKWEEGVDEWNASKIDRDHVLSLLSTVRGVVPAM